MTDEKSHILVVDDELSMRELLEIMLQKEGYRVSCAESGTKAVAFLKKEKVDLLLPPWGTAMHFAVGQLFGAGRMPFVVPVSGFFALFQAFDDQLDYIFVKIG